MGCLQRSRILPYAVFSERSANLRHSDINPLPTRSPRRRGSKLDHGSGRSSCPRRLRRHNRCGAHKRRRTVNVHHPTRVDLLGLRLSSRLPQSNRCRRALYRVEPRHHFGVPIQDAGARGWRVQYCSADWQECRTSDECSHCIQHHGALEISGEEESASTDGGVSRCVLVSVCVEWRYGFAVCLGVAGHWQSGCEARVILNRSHAVEKRNRKYSIHSLFSRKAWTGIDWPSSND